MSLEDGKEEVAAAKCRLLRPLLKHRRMMGQVTREHSMEFGVWGPSTEFTTLLSRHSRKTFLVPHGPWLPFSLEFSSLLLGSDSLVMYVQSIY